MRTRFTILALSTFAVAAVYSLAEPILFQPTSTVLTRAFATDCESFWVECDRFNQEIEVYQKRFQEFFEEYNNQKTINRLKRSFVSRFFNWCNTVLHHIDRHYIKSLQDRNNHMMCAAGKIKLSPELTAHFKKTQDKYLQVRKTIESFREKLNNFRTKTLQPGLD